MQKLHKRHGGNNLLGSQSDVIAILFANQFVPKILKDKPPKVQIAIIAADDKLRRQILSLEYAFEAHRFFRNNGQTTCAYKIQWELSNSSIPHFITPFQMDNIYIPTSVQFKGQLGAIIFFAQAIQVLSMQNQDYQSDGKQFCGPCPKS
jgi:hypothetical protein